MPNDPKYSVSNQGSFINLKTWGKLETEDLDHPINAALDLAKKTNTFKLLDDIREVDSKDIALGVQAKAAGILWKMRNFKKVAVVMAGKEISWMFFTFLEELHLNSKFKGFDNVTDAIAWLESSE